MDTVCDYGQKWSELPPSYYFDTLAVHPEPQPLEAFTGYLLRLADLNDIRGLAGLSALTLLPTKIIHYLDDNPLASYGFLPIVAARSKAELDATTFFHFIEKFGCQPTDKGFNGLLQDSIGKYLRYCPTCLSKYGFYSLLWRFPALQGCPEHGCHLLDRCSNCGQEIPLLRRPLKLGYCPYCGQDLRTSPMVPLNERELHRAESRYKDLAFLLSAQPVKPTEEAQWAHVNRRFNHFYCEKRRREKRFRCNEELHQVRGQVHVSRVITRIEPLESYFMYADWLGVTLQEMFRVDQPKTDLRKSEEEYVQRITELLEQEVVYADIWGTRTSQTIVARTIGVPLAKLNEYEHLRELLNLFPIESKAEEQRRLEHLVEQAEEQLESEHRKVTQTAISRILGIPLQALMQYPNIKVSLAMIDAKQKLKEEEQQELIRKIEEVEKRMFGL